MPAKPRWLLSIPDAISQLENLDRQLLTRRDIERLFGVSKAKAATLMQTFGAEMTGSQRTLPRTRLLQQLKKHRGRAAFRGEEERRARLVTALRRARITGSRVPRRGEPRAPRGGGAPETPDPRDPPPRTPAHAAADLRGPAPEPAKPRPPDRRSVSPEPASSSVS
ncbi:MAG: hypothetical protein OXG35_32020, partial [Acidobacteria bacterium]|nr:hypothetical protein [Acidobacteriota bacterium]